VIKRAENRLAQPPSGYLCHRSRAHEVLVQERTTQHGPIVAPRHRASKSSAVQAVGVTSRVVIQKVCMVIARSAAGQRLRMRHRPRAKKDYTCVRSSLANERTEASCARRGSYPRGD